MEANQAKAISILSAAKTVKESFIKGISLLQNDLRNIQVKK